MIPRRVLLASLLLFCARIGGAAAEKPQKWVEVRSENFVVISNAGERQARKVAVEFEKVRVVFRAALPFASQHGSPVVTILGQANNPAILCFLFFDFGQEFSKNEFTIVAAETIIFKTSIVPI